MFQPNEKPNVQNKKLKENNVGNIANFKVFCWNKEKSLISEEWSFSIVQHVRILYFTLVVKV